jgi:2-polyprenyl-3-methyl-5-hydroxy-6-metoxy-1,4-benzoquinol methylase
VAKAKGPSIAKAKALPPPEPVDFDAIVREERPQAERIAEYFATRMAKGTRVLDVGCGPGIYVNAMRARGIEARGCDIDSRVPHGPDHFFQCDFRKGMSVTAALEKLGKWPEIVLSLEVGEHIEKRYADDYVRFINHVQPEGVFFSAARPGQGGIGHINCQFKHYWVALFHEVGFYYHPEATEDWLNFMRQGPHMGWLTQNGMVFERV